MIRGMPWPAVGVVGGAEACAGTTGHGRREQAVPPALLWRLEQEDQRLKKHDGRWIDIQWLRLLESFVDVYNN